VKILVISMLISLCSFAEAEISLPKVAGKIINPACFTELAVAGNSDNFVKKVIISDAMGRGCNNSNEYLGVVKAKKGGVFLTFAKGFRKTGFEAYEVWAKKGDLYLIYSLSNGGGTYTASTGLVVKFSKEKIFSIDKGSKKEYQVDSIELIGEIQVNNFKERGKAISDFNKL
jgi:hypothetical protein